ncbi:DsbA family protein [Maridesulfovibrio salexigens]|uniref:DSBA oxidoreductase n=1 Tax=Maridesulfovibrio salexigens (strain ATCC 14822 / DSM 2638 / NCIMB 8403 / VKM B-1763) TaxID=526222 RepID=C6BVC0_MARSD|nr:thioredoxin domain-containing protein [Maridesulfovibrio salexigens]ACS80095.1 DSBA oxidoreductase [Maridesulfovibrio salexigens DSM 2638]
MLKRIALVICLVVMFSGCVNKQMLKEQIAEVIRENPQIVLDAMRENSVDMLTIVEQGIDQREKQKREAMLEAEIKNPFKPRVWSERPMLGSPEAPVTIVEYTDFLCPYCSKGAKVVSKLVAEQPEKYRLIFKHLPMHKNSRELALVFEAIAQFDKERAYKFHDLAFERQKDLYEDKEGIVLSKILEEVAVDPDLLQKHLRSPKLQAFLLADEKEAGAFGIDATPTFLVNGVSVRGYLPADRFEQMVDMIMEKSGKAATSETIEGEVCEDCLNQM